MAALQGIDVSNHQRVVQWPLVAADGNAFAFMKATESIGFTDFYFARNWKESRENDLVRGAYHYARPSRNHPNAEATHFVKVLEESGGLLQSDMIALDMEDPDMPANDDDHACLDWTLKWLEAVETLTGVRPLLYSGVWYLQSRGLLHNWLSPYPLWLAGYQTSQPPPPLPWKEIAIWQWTSQGSVPGVQGNCDCDMSLVPLASLGKPPGPTPAEEWANVLNVIRGWSAQMAQGSKELADTADIIARLLRDSTK